MAFMLLKDDYCPFDSDFCECCGRALGIAVEAVRVGFKKFNSSRHPDVWWTVCEDCVDEVKQEIT